MYTKYLIASGFFLLFKEFGELQIILIQNDVAVYFVMDIHKADYHSEYYLYSVAKQIHGCNVLKLMTWIETVKIEMLKTILLNII